MIWLAAHMWFLLFISFAVGLGVGWRIWGARTDQAPPPASSPPGDTAMGTLDSDGGTDKGDL